MSRVARLVGLGLTGVGLAHFAKPEVFEDLTATAFPTNIREHIYINGAIETVLGLGMLAGSTRKLAVVGLIGYTGYLGAHALTNGPA